MVVDLSLPLRLQAGLAVQFRDMNHHADENREPRNASFDDARLDVFDIGAAIDYEQRECIGLEPATVWEPHGVEKRLLDAFMGRPNPVMERIRRELGQ